MVEILKNISTNLIKAIKFAKIKKVKLFALWASQMDMLLKKSDISIFNKCE